MLVKKKPSIEQQAKNNPGSFILCGHQRSGTTMLRELCNSHPRITGTLEFSCYTNLGEALLPFLIQTYGRVLLRGGRYRLPGLLTKRGTQPVNLKNLSFLIRFLFDLCRQGPGPVDIPRLRRCYANQFPTSNMVGDKYPDYVFQLDKFCRTPDLQVVAIVRDCRDVAASVLKLVRSGSWKGKWTRPLQTAESIARRWNESAQLLARNSDQVLLFRYEDFVSDPDASIRKLSEYFQVDPCGFPSTLPHAQSIGNYRGYLTSDEINSIVRTAFEGMERFGYLSQPFHR
jgi:hypothetical protein